MPETIEAAAPGRNAASAPEQGGDASAARIPQLVSELYRHAPAPLRRQLLECLLKPVGPLAIVTIAAGAFAHLLYRLRLQGVPVSLDDAARVSSEHVFELARYVAQANPDTLLRMGALIADSPFALATVAGAALLAALDARRG